MKINRLAFPLALTGMVTAGAAFADERFAGLSAGVQLGYVQAQTIHDDPESDCWYWCMNGVRRTDDGGSFGAKVDYNIVNGALLYGVRGELSVTSVDTKVEMVPTDPSYELGTKTKLLGALSGKVGVVSGKLAVYGLVGIAFADADQRYDETDGTGEYFRRSGESTGFFFGVGTEYAISDTASIGVDIGSYRFSEGQPTLLDSGGSPIGEYFPLQDRYMDLKVSYNIKF
ncbi:MAG: outer membrane protein [Alcanivoracaceae bacterium]